jgi:hypothetical protein
MLLIKRSHRYGFTLLHFLEEKNGEFGKENTPRPTLRDRELEKNSSF